MVIRLAELYGARQRSGKVPEINKLQRRIFYIKPLVRTSAPIMPDSKKLKRIFTEIRDKQSALKNRAGIAGKRITHPDRVIDLGRVVKRRDIELLVIQRILNRDFLRDDTPKSFIHKSSFAVC